MSDLIVLTAVLSIISLYILMLVVIWKWGEKTWILSSILGCLVFFNLNSQVWEWLQSAAGLTLLVVGAIAAWKTNRKQFYIAMFLIAVLAASMFSLWYFYDWTVTFTIFWEVFS